MATPWSERVDKRPGLKRGSDEWRERVRVASIRGQALKAERRKVRPGDLHTLRMSGTVRAELLPFIGLAERETAELVGALGGIDAVSPQRRILIEDLARMGLCLRGELARYMQTADGEAAGRVATIGRARAATLAQLGLDRFERDVPDLRTYTAQRAADTAKDRLSDAIATPADIDADDAERGLA